MKEIKMTRASMDALNFSITYADTVLSEDISGYAKVVFLSEFLELAYEKGIEVDSELFKHFDEGYELASARVFDYIYTSDQKLLERLGDNFILEQQFTQEYMRFVAFMTSSIFNAKVNSESNEKNAFSIKNKALNIIKNELNKDLTKEELTSQETYELYLNETKKKQEEIDSKIYKLAKLG